MDLAVIIVCIHEGDFLRQTLSRSRRALPDAKFCVVYVNEDVETKAICEALRVYTTVSMPAETLLVNNATYNVSAFIRTAQLRMKEMLQKPVWTIITRPQVILDSNLAAMDYSQLETANVYGSFFDPILNHTDLLRFQAKEPTAAEVREFVPTREFLLSFGAKDYPSWSTSAREATEEFLGQFTFQYMLQLKLGHLGPLNDDAEVRLSKRWEERHRVITAPPVRVAPVHAGAAQQKEEEKKESQKIPEKKEEEKKEEKKEEEKKEEPKKNSKLSKMFQPVDKSDGSTMSTARKEVDQQNILQAKELPKPEEKAETKDVAIAKPLQKKKNPFQVNLDKVEKA